MNYIGVTIDTLKHYFLQEQLENTQVLAIQSAAGRDKIVVLRL